MNTFNILQLTDLHLSANPQKIVAGVNCHQGFENALNQALAEATPCDLILLTGDLVNEIDPTIYDHIFSKLSKTGIPFACIAGNHDVTDVLNPQDTFDKRQFIACEPDSRLLNQHLIETEHWQILLINSSVTGKVYGKVDTAELDWLTRQLSDSYNPAIHNPAIHNPTVRKPAIKPTIIVMHHHALPMDSAWIDKHILQNTDEFWATIAPFKQVKAVVSGHTHQASEQIFNGIKCFTTPSTGYQYKPKQTEFAYDDKVTAGYRWLYLHDDGTISSEVKRLV